MSKALRRKHRHRSCFWTETFMPTLVVWDDEAMATLMNANGNIWIVSGGLDDNLAEIISRGPVRRRTWEAGSDDG